MSRWAAAGALALTFVVTLAPNVAFACPVCFSTVNDANRLAYLLTAVFLTLLPFVVVGGILLWVVRRARSLEASPVIEAASGDDVSQH